MPATSKAPNDYTDSADLSNPDCVKHLLHQLHALQSERVKILEPIQAQVDAIDAAIETQIDDIKALIERSGSYQDPEAGEYALKQRVKTINYDPGKTGDVLGEDMSRMVIESTVNKTKMAGLVKGGFISQATADKCGEFAETYRFIIK
jgi:hypothetical protein